MIEFDKEWMDKQQVTPLWWMAKRKAPTKESANVNNLKPIIAFNGTSGQGITGAVLCQGTNYIRTGGGVINERQ